MQQTGIVKWFNNAKGYGFIIPDESGGDIFAHYSSIDMEGYKTLKAGQLVAFETIPGPKGLHASSIHPLDKVNPKKSTNVEHTEIAPEEQSFSDSVR